MIRRKYVYSSRIASIFFVISLISGMDLHAEEIIGLIKLQEIKLTPRDYKQELKRLVDAKGSGTESGSLLFSNACGFQTSVYHVLESIGNTSTNTTKFEVEGVLGEFCKPEGFTSDAVVARVFVDDKGNAEIRASVRLEVDFQSVSYFAFVSDLDRDGPNIFSKSTLAAIMGRAVKVQNDKGVFWRDIQMIVKSKGL